MTKKQSPSERGETFGPIPVSLFTLGEIVATPGVLDAVVSEYLLTSLCRHVTGDWGNVCDEDSAANFEALLNGDRIHSAYPIDPNQPCAGYGSNCLWIITEADRSVTTFLLPDEY